MDTPSDSAYEQALREHIVAIDQARESGDFTKHLVSIADLTRLLCHSKKKPQYMLPIVLQVTEKLPDTKHGRAFARAVRKKLLSPGTAVSFPEFPHQVYLNSSSSSRPLVSSVEGAGAIHGGPHGTTTAMDSTVTVLSAHQDSTMAKDEQGPLQKRRRVGEVVSSHLGQRASGRFMSATDRLHGRNRGMAIQGTHLHIP
ncbi:hypothetical protein BS47DRAFT_1361253 [Hydnum rufescens UP504]|uniref:Uncharacterized protein n=1 Tax=Hydnum rufescens UP504 TaxID=1448309 RepID=A0A9P6B2M3_9AGAM|nr:hypothetical protein BS47DRAFT_1361253 [Hydnum rufescens UP504]